MHTRNCFVTLTYSEEFLPDGGTLCPEDMTLFWKRLRKSLGPELRYFYCGEYGSRSLRPHYHALIFGTDFHFDRYLWRDRPGGRLYRSPLLESKWELGQCEVGALEFGSARYVANYIMKDGLRDSRNYERVDRSTGEVWSVLPEFVRMSRRPGIGAKWIEKFGASDVFPRDEVVFEGVRFRTPRFYDSRMRPEVLVATKSRRTAAMREREARGGFTERKLSDGEALLRSKLKLKADRSL